MVQMASMTASEFSSILNVSRETLERLKVYETMLRIWQNKINLVGPSTLDDVWRRHFLDSGQLCKFLGKATTVADFGSGGGFPGLVVAIISDLPVVMVESDKRKAVFLREVSRETSANTEIIEDRIENIKARPAEALTVRALAPVAKLLNTLEPWVSPGGVCYFLKGLTVEDELTDAMKYWDINYDIIPSLSDPLGSILCIREFYRV